MNTVVILVSCIYGFWAVGLVFVACEVGQRLTYAYVRFADEIEKLDWNLFPLKIQRMLPTIMNNSQVPLELMCFGSTTVSRDTFKRVSLIMKRNKMNSGFDPIEQTNKPPNDLM